MKALREALVQIKEEAEGILRINWGYDGDGGATSLAERILDACNAAQAMSTPSPVAPVAPFPLPLKQGDYVSYHGSVLYADPTPETKAECFVPVAQCESEEYAAYLCAAANAYPQLVEALEECRDILCALAASDGAVKLAYMMPEQIPAAIWLAYTALEKAGLPAAQEGGK